MKQKLKEFHLPFFILPLVLILFVFFSYGIVAGKLGIYWDDWAYLWTRLELGYEGLVRHFSFSRPVAGQLHNLAILLTGKNPLRIQMFGLAMRVIGSSMVGTLVYRIWNRDSFLASLCALFFIAYPGFTMQPIAINFGFSYFLIAILCLSFVLTIEAVRNPSRRILYELTALLLAAVNLFASEYFFLLELLRPLLIWTEISKNVPESGGRFRKTLQREIPYAALFVLGSVYRAFFNRTQTLHYDFSLLAELKLNPLKAIGGYLSAIIADCYKVVVPAWLRVFEFPKPELLGERTFLVYCAVCLIIFLLVLCYFLFLKKSPESGRKKSAIELILIGSISLLLAGQPFWLTNTTLSFVFQNSRYTLPFMLGVSFIWTGGLGLIKRPRFLSVVITAILIGLSAGSHFVNANEYRRDWTLTKDFFWQLKWRVPAIEENTVVITNVLPIRFSTDNSLTAPLNWIYADEYKDTTMPYMLYTNTKREAALSGLKSDQSIFQEYLSAQFFGKTSDAVSLYFNPPGCVHILDPEVDLFNQTIPIIDRNAALLNNYSRILTGVPYQPLDQEIFGPEPAHGWCWYYEQADLSRQKEDWEKVAQLGNEAFGLSDHPNDPMERIPFIEGYAHVSDWEQATAQTRAALEVTPVMNNPLCVLWNRIDTECADSEEKTVSIETVNQILDCAFIQ